MTHLNGYDFDELNLEPDEPLTEEEEAEQAAAEERERLHELGLDA